MDRTVLELKRLTKDFPSHRAVDRVTFSIANGEFFSLLGPSGCGKTTTLRLVAGLEQPDSGQILLAGEDLAGLPAYRRDVSTVFQNYALFPHLTVAQNVAFGLERKGIEKRATAAKVAKALELVQLSGKESRLPYQISGGERQRVALARSLVLEPKLLLLDEPLSALDAKLRKEMRTQLKSLQRRIGIAFLFVTHDQDEALSLSDRVAIMNRGVLEQVGSPQEVYRHPQSRFVAEFLGEVNWLNGVGVRPEAIEISRAPGNGKERASGTIESRTYLGSIVHVTVRMENAAVCTAQVFPQDDAWQPGDRACLYWRDEDEIRVPEGTTP